MNVMELSRKQTAIILGATAGIAGAGAMLWFLSRSAAADTSQVDCSAVDRSSTAIWSRPKWVLQETYHGVKIYKDTLKTTQDTHGGTVPNPSYGTFGAFIGSTEPSGAVDIADVRQMIDQACGGGGQTYGAPVIRPSSVPREMPTNQERPHPEWCDCYSCGC